MRRRETLRNLTNAHRNKDKFCLKVINMLMNYKIENTAFIFMQYTKIV